MSIITLKISIGVGNMTEEKMFNPFLLWKSMYETTESNLSKVIDDTLGKEEYAEFLGNVQNEYLQYQKWIQSTTDTYLTQMNIPTRDEISSMASLIINLEEKVENLNETIEEDQLNQSVTSEISKIKTNISKLDKKLNQILKALESDDDASDKKPATNKK